MAVYVGGRRKRMKKLPLVIAGALILVLMIGGIFLVTKGTGAEQTEPETVETEVTTESNQGTLPANAFPIKVTNE